MDSGCINKESGFKLLQNKKQSSVNQLSQPTSFIDNLKKKGLLLLQGAFQKIKEICIYQKGYISECRI